MSNLDGATDIEIIRSLNDSMLMLCRATAAVQTLYPEYPAAKEHARAANAAYQFFAMEELEATRACLERITFDADERPPGVWAPTYDTCKRAGEELAALLKAREEMSRR